MADHSLVVALARSPPGITGRSFELDDRYCRIFGFLVSPPRRVMGVRRSPLTIRAVRGSTLQSAPFCRLPGMSRVAPRRALFELFRCLYVRFPYFCRDSVTPPFSVFWPVCWCSCLDLFVFSELKSCVCAQLSWHRIHRPFISCLFIQALVFAAWDDPPKTNQPINQHTNGPVFPRPDSSTRPIGAARASPPHLGMQAPEHPPPRQA